LLGFPSVKHLDDIAGVVDRPAVFTLRVKVANWLMLGSQVITFLLVHKTIFFLHQRQPKPPPPLAGTPIL